MKSLKVILTVVLILFVTFLPKFSQAASFSSTQNNEHPCLDQVSLPWKISPVKRSDVPEAYKDWPSISAGFWGGSLCHALILIKITEGGVVDFLYSTGKPFFGHGQFVGIITSIEGVQHLKASLDGGVKVEYTLNKYDAAVPFILLEGMWQSKVSTNPSIGTFKPVKEE